MKRLLGYFFSPIFWLTFGFILLIFHPIQILCRHLGGYSLRKKSVDAMNLLLLYCLVIMGSRIRFSGLSNIPKNRPLIIVSNHQSFFDIPPIIWAFRRHHPKFVSKKELEFGFPSISYNLRHGGSALIDRKDINQSIGEISKLGKHIEEKNYSASIFPEGTRSKTGLVNRFKHMGITTLLENAPSALIIPFVIDGNFDLISKGYFPLSFGRKLHYKALHPIDPSGMEPKELCWKIEQLIKQELGQQ